MANQNAFCIYHLFRGLLKVQSMSNAKLQRATTLHYDETKYDYEPGLNLNVISLYLLTNEK